MRQAHMSGATPGTFRARSFGRWALRQGRPELLRSAPSLNAGRGRGQVTRYQTGSVTVGGPAVRISSGNGRRKKLRLANITHLNANGTESSAWVFKNGKWQTPDGQAAVSARLAYAWDRQARAGDPAIDVGGAVLNEEDKGALWISGTGTPGAVVRYQVAELTDFPVW